LEIIPKDAAAMKQGATKLYAMHIISPFLKGPCDRYTYFWLGTHKAASVSARFEGPAGCFLESWVVWLALYSHVHEC